MATFLLDLHILLLDLRAFLLDLALPQTTPPYGPPLGRFSKLCLGRNSSDSRGLELRYHAAWQEAFQHIVWFSASFPFCPLLNFYFSPLFRPFSVTQGLNLMSTWVKVPRLGTFLWFQYLNFPPCASHQTSYISCIHWVSISILPPSLSATSCIHLIQYLNFTPGAPQQFPTFIWLHMWHPLAFPAISCKHLVQYSTALTHLCLPATSCIHAVSISRLLPLVSPQLLACIVIWVQYFCASNFLFPQCASQLPASIWFHMYVPPGGLSTTSCVYAVSISEFLLHPCASQQLPAWIWFNISASLVSQRLLALIWFQYLTNFPPMCLSSNLLSFLHSLGFNFYTSPVASPQLLAFILFQYHNV